MSEKKSPDWEGFGQAVLEGWPEAFGVYMDGMDLQELGEAYGVLIGEEKTEPCGEGCNCEEYGFPVTCYRVAK